MPSSKALVWFRRDLRNYDHAALFQALKTSNQVYCVFVFDTNILQHLPKKDRRVEFIWHSVIELKYALQAQGGDLMICHGDAIETITSLAIKLNIDTIFSNRDYEPTAIARDAAVAKSVLAQKIAFEQYKDQVIFEKDEVLNLSGKPYGVFTPYKNMWLKTVSDAHLSPFSVDDFLHHLAPPNPEITPTVTSLESMGFEETNLRQMPLPTGMQGGLKLFDDFRERIAQYKTARDFPSVKGVSYLSVHLRFGTVSIRHLAREAKLLANAGAETWLNELIWREFYFQILHFNPNVAKGKSFKAEFNAIPFPNDETLFKAWCEGNTGYPLVDAAMRQLNTTGYMHNRLRMVAASFLVKDLLIDWRWGEHYFATQLIDFDLSANNGGWQWAASTGCDAQPWFRIFNPVTQSERFDAEGKFIRRYCPELKQCDNKEIHAPWLIPSLKQLAMGLKIGQDYPAPVVDHATQRALALELYKSQQKKAGVDDAAMLSSD